jgi:hypothetical protein
MSLLNLWSLGHFFFWFSVACFVTQSVIIFIVLFLLSISWEAVELAIPNDFADESWENKGMDVVINVAGFLFGTFFRWLWLCFSRKDADYP